MDLTRDRDTCPDNRCQTLERAPGFALSPASRGLRRSVPRTGFAGRRSTHAPDSTAGSQQRMGAAVERDRQAEAVPRPPPRYSVTIRLFLDPFPEILDLAA